MFDRIENARQGSDVAVFHDLLYLGEMVTHLTGHANWQYDANELLHTALLELDSQAQPLPPRADGRRWLNDFTVLWNNQRVGCTKQHLLQSRFHKSKHRYACSPTILVCSGVHGHFSTAITPESIGLFA